MTVRAFIPLGNKRTNDSSSVKFLLPEERGRLTTSFLSTAVSKIEKKVNIFFKKISLFKTFSAPKKYKLTQQSQYE